MDQLMVEAPAGSDVSLGDEAVLVGAQGSAVLTMDELAEAAGTINYEIVTRMGSSRVPRVYRGPA